MTVNFDQDRFQNDLTSLFLSHLGTKLNGTYFGGCNAKTGLSLGHFL